MNLNELQKYVDAVDPTTLNRESLLELNLLADELKKRKNQEECQKDFLTFVAISSKILEIL